jgi:hypothetical protein
MKLTGLLFLYVNCAGGVTNVLYLYSCWGGNVSLKIHLNPLDSVFLGFHYFPSVQWRNASLTCKNSDALFFNYTCGHIHPWGLLFQLLNRMNQYWVVSWRVGMQVTFGSPVVMLLVSVDVPKCTRSWLWARLCARSHFHGYQLSPSSLIIIYCIDSAGNPIVSSP